MAKHLESVGERYKDKQVELLGLKYLRLNNSSLTQLPSVQIETNGLITRYNKEEANKWFGFNVEDKEGNFLYYCFANKAEFVEKFLKFKERQTMFNLKGIVVELESSTDYGIILTDIEVLE